MRERTTLEIASRLESLMPIAGRSAVKALRQQHAEIARLTKQAAAYELLTKSQEAQLSAHRAKADEYRAAVASLESERAANAQLTAEIERLASIDAALVDKSNAYVIENARLAEKIDRLTAEKFRRFNNEECWIYQRAGENHLGTLTCPVVISPEALLLMQGEISILTAERDAHVAEIDRLKRERDHIYDLLARIHRDGGQYTAEHGVEKACDDAEAQVVTWLDTISGVDALIEQARIAERAANSMLIAAAPDLLEVCRRLTHVSLFAVDEDVASIIMQACDSVQKATGEKP